MRTGNITLFLTALVFMMTIPHSAYSGPSIEEVRKNVDSIVEAATKNVARITVQELKRKMERGEEFVLVDVRTLAEYDAGHLPGAISISRGVVEWKTPDTVSNTDAQIIVYCRTGKRSALVTKRLSEMGYTNVTSVSGSFKAWLEAGYPIYNLHGEFILTKGGFQKKEPK